MGRSIDIYKETSQSKTFKISVSYMHANEAVVCHYNPPRGRPKPDAFSTRGFEPGAEEI